MSNPVTAPQLTELQRGAQARGRRFRLFDVRSREDIEQAFGALDKSSDAIIVGLEALTQAHRHLIAELAARGRLPAIYGGRVEAGGLIFIMGRVSLTSIAGQRLTLTKSLKGQSPPICRSSNQPSSS